MESPLIALTACPGHMDRLESQLVVKCCFLIQHASYVESLMQLGLKPVYTVLHADAYMQKKVLSGADLFLQQ